MMRYKGRKAFSDQLLSRIDRETDYGALQPLLRGNINLRLILEQWDQLVRLAASLKDRLTPAHVVMQRLANANASDLLAGALSQLGRLMKTVHILRYIQSRRSRSATPSSYNSTAASFAISSLSLCSSPTRAASGPATIREAWDLVPNQIVKVLIRT
jgi:TnpA family transposase